MLIERKILVIEKHTTPFWKEKDKAITYMKMNKKICFWSGTACALNYLKYFNTHNFAVS